MTKAQKIFEDTYTECRIHAKRWGYERTESGRAIGFASLVTEEVTCRRTWNEIQRLIDREKKEIEMCKKLDIEINSVREFALEMVQETLNNCIKAWEK